jgi:hypothetical protein
MSSILIQDLARNHALDKRQMSAVRGGLGPDVNVNVTLNQQFAQFQQISVDVLNNNGVVGAAGLDFGHAAEQWKENHTTITPL